MDYLRTPLLDLTLDRVSRLRITPKTDLGQHFLIDDAVLSEMVEEARLTKEDVVVEVGTGLGILTEMLAEASRVTYSFEVDEALFDSLEEEFSFFENIILLKTHFSRERLEEIIHQESGSTIKVVTSLPFQITSYFLETVIELIDNLELVVVLLQREVARRLVANPDSKTYGSLTLFARSFCDVFIVRSVPATSFMPVPKVDASLVVLRKRKEGPLPVKDRKLYFDIIDAGFKSRRKTLENALLRRFGSLRREKIKEIFERVGIDPKRRGETLSLEEFVKLANNFYY